MAISKAKKTEKVKLLAKELETSTTAIIGTFSKLTVAKDYELRKVIREAGGKYRVVKNKLAAVSSEGSSIGPALKGLKGVNSVAFTSGDPVALAKVFAKWAGENAEFQFKLGIVDGKLLNVEEVKALAKLPEERYQSGQDLVNDLEKCKASPAKVVGLVAPRCYRRMANVSSAEDGAITPNTVASGP